MANRFALNRPIYFVNIQDSPECLKIKRSELETPVTHILDIHKREICIKVIAAPMEL